MSLCTYNPQISPGGSLTPPPSTLPVILTKRSTVLFEYPYTDPTTTLELRNPEFNDHRAIDLSRVQRYSRGKTLIVYRDPTWPKSFSISYSFTGLSITKKDEIMSFISISLGKEIKFTDYLTQVYKCIITNPKDFLSEESQSCGNTWKVNLQGILV